MIDLHSHILPGIDDGAGTQEDALEMARAAAADGIRIVAATPHHNNGRYTNRAQSILEGVDQMRGARSGFCGGQDYSGCGADEIY